MKQIISPKIKKARARKEKFERFKIKLYSYKVIKYITKQYKKTGQLVIELDPYKFKEEKLIKVLELLKKEKQLDFKIEDDMYIVQILLRDAHLQKTTEEKPNQPIKTQEKVPSAQPQEKKPKAEDDDEVLKF